MQKFMFLYRDPIQKSPPNLSPDQVQDHMQSWWDWLGEGKAAGWVLEMGDPLTSEMRIVQHDRSIIDGPYPEAKELVGGYSIIQATDFAAACQHAMGCPIFESGGSVEVRQIPDMSESA